MKFINGFLPHGITDSSTLYVKAVDTVHVLRRTALGCIGIAEEGGCLAELVFDPDWKDQASSSPLLKEAFAQLNAYLEGRLAVFSLPLLPAQTTFQKVFQTALCSVPYGRTLSYKDLADQMDRPHACRAVGNACHRNPLPIFIPCHRLVGRSRPYLYRGGEARKRFLLDLERKTLKTKITSRSMFFG